VDDGFHLGHALQKAGEATSVQALAGRLLVQKSHTAALYQQEMVVAQLVGQLPDGYQVIQGGLLFTLEEQSLSQV